MLSNFRGFVCLDNFPKSSEPYFNGSEFSVSEKVVPASVEYKVDDLLAVGKVSPVSTEVLHDSSAVDNLVNSDSSVVDTSNK